MSGYVLSGWSWPDNTVTWSYSGNSSFTAEVRGAFAAWDSAVAIDFVEVPRGQADIVVGFSFIDGQGGTLGFANTTYLLGSNEIISSTIVFDISENWRWFHGQGGGHRLSDGSTFAELAKHEIGHAIGLDHSADPHVLMYQWIDGTASDLTYWDIYGARTIYGPESSGNGGRQLNHVEALTYIASYADLIQAFGANATAGNAHFRQHGQSEGREITFDDLEYLASYWDLVEAFGANETAGSTHFIRHGFFEGRTTTFDGLEYIASHVDLLIAFGSVSDAGATHYLQHGYRENRVKDAFDAGQYLSNYGDLQAAFGNDLELVTIHYIDFGFSEGRVDEFIF